MSMLKNEKAILVYGATDKEFKEFQEIGIKLIMVTDEMMDMKVKDIVSGLRFEIVNKEQFNDKVILFNDLTDEELTLMINITKSIVDNPILAVITPTSREWEFKNLVEHLIEEREWHMRRERKILSE